MDFVHYLDKRRNTKSAPQPCIMDLFSAWYKRVHLLLLFGETVIFINGKSDTVNCKAAILLGRTRVSVHISSGIYQQEKNY